MALPPLLEPKDKEWLFKVTNKISTQPERDLCLLGYFLGTPMTTLEINRLQLKDVLHKSGKLNKQFVIRGCQSFNGEDRKVFLLNKRLRELTLNYLSYRVKKNIGIGDNPDQYLGLDPYDALFITAQGKGFSIVSKKTTTGAPSYSCDALNRHIKKLLKSSGVENPSVLSGRRTFAVTLKRKGYDESYIHLLLGNKDWETTKKLLTSDPVNIGLIAAEAF